MIRPRSTPTQVRCPFCSAAPGSPCRGRQNETLAGVHFQRVRISRNAVAAALAYYACIGLRTKRGPQDLEGTDARTLYEDHGRGLHLLPDLHEGDHVENRRRPPAVVHPLLRTEPSTTGQKQAGTTGLAAGRIVLKRFLR